MFCPKLVVSHLLKEFGSCDLERAPSRKELKIISSFTYILREAMYDNLIIECEEDTVVEDGEGDPLVDVDDGELTPSTEGSFLFGNVEVPREQVERAIAFYRASAKGSRPLSSMSAHFRFIRTDYHLLKLRRIEQESRTRADRLLGLRALAEILREEVASKLGQGITLHDCDLRQMALRINEERSLVDGFKAGHAWILGFKRKCGIVSRRITSFCSRKSFLDRERVSNEAENFVQKVKTEMEKWPLNAVCNADQSGFLKEMHTSRSLAFRGSKKVERVVQSVSATTHSFTVMPSLYADGHLGPKLFVVMQEATGEFPARGYFPAKNLEVRASRTHMMSKQLMLEWVQHCVAGPDSPASTLLVVDSWTSFKDHEAIRSVLPPQKQIEIFNIPPGATSQIQPLDVYFFMPFKAMYKRITAHVIAHDINFHVYARDSILRLLSLVYFQFCAPRFRNFLLYSWYAAGYLSTHPGTFETPAEFCFPSQVVSVCDITGCDKIFFIRCSHCEQLLCFDHFVLGYHICS